MYYICFEENHVSSSHELKLINVPAAAPCTHSTHRVTKYYAIRRQPNISFSYYLFFLCPLNT